MNTKRHNLMQISVFFKKIKFTFLNPRTFIVQYQTNGWKYFFEQN